MLNVIVTALVTLFASLILYSYYYDRMVDRALKSKLALKEAEITAVTLDAMDKAFNKGYQAAIKDLNAQKPNQD